MKMPLCDVNYFTGQSQLRIVEFVLSADSQNESWILIPDLPHISQKGKPLFHSKYFNFLACNSRMSHSEFFKLPRPLVSKHQENLFYEVEMLKPWCR